MDDIYLKKYQEIYHQITLKAEEKQEDLAKEILLSKNLSAMKPDYEGWLRECLERKDWNGLNNLIFQVNRHALLPVPSGGGGYDHCGQFLNLLSALACGDLDTVERIFPYELGLTSNGYPFYVIAGNLFLALWYKWNGVDSNELLLKKALPKAEKFIISKKPQWERAVTAYLLALCKEDMTEAGNRLQEVCNAYMRSDMAPVKKLLCVEVHGLYCLAFYILPKEQYQQIVMPEHKNFSKTYAAWRMEHQKPELELYFKYPETMELVNRIYLAPVARTKLHQPYLEQDNPYMSAKEKKQWHLNGEAMLEDFVKYL